MRQPSFLSNVTFLWIMQITSYLLPLATLPYLVRTLGLFGYGRLVFALSVMQLIVLLVDSGFNTISQRDMSQQGNDPDSLSRIVWTSMAARGLVSLFGLGFVTLWVYLANFDAQDRMLFASASLLVIGTLSFPQWLFVGLQNTRPMVFLHLFGRGVSMLLIFLLVHGQADLITAAVVQASATAISGFASLVWLARSNLLKLKSPSFLDIHSLLNRGMRIGVPGFFVSAASNATVFLLGIFSSPELVGVFGAVDKIIRAASGLFNAVIQAAYPIMCARSSDAAFDRLGLRIGSSAVGIALIASITAILFASPLLQIAFGGEVSGHSVILSAMAPAMVGVCISSSIGYLFLLPLGHDKTYGRIQMATALIAWAVYTIAASTSDPVLLALSVTGVEVISAAMFCNAAVKLMLGRRQALS